MGTQISKAKIKQLEAKGKDGRMLMEDWLGVWLDPKYGKVGEEFTYSKGPRAGETGITTSFHAVTSGFNEATQMYYDASPIDFLKEAESRKLITLRPVGKGRTGKGVPGVRVYPYSDTTNRGSSILASMGLTPKS